MGWTSREASLGKAPLIKRSNVLLNQNKIILFFIHHGCEDNNAE